MSSNGINAKAQAGMFRFLLKGKAAMQDVTKRTLMKIGERLVYYSVVGEPTYWKHKPHKDYAPGHFINNWQLGVDEKPTGVIDGVDPSGRASLDRMKAAIPRYPVGKTFYFVNNVPYARLLESGEHSLQTPPGGMVGRTVLEFHQMVREAETEYSKES